MSGKIQEETVTSQNNNYSGSKNQNQNHCVSETEHLGFPRLLSSSGLRVLLDCFCYGHTHTHRDVRVNNSYPSKSISDLPTLFTSASCGLARDGPGLRPERPGGKGAQAPATSGTLVCWLGLGGTARKTGGRLQAEGRWVSRDPL